MSLKNGKHIIKGLAASMAAMLLAGTLQAQAPGGPPPGGPPPRPSVTQVKGQYPGGVEALYDIDYATLEGIRPLKLDIYRVPGGGPKPTIVFVHGGGFAGGSNRGIEEPWGRVDELLARVASQGYVVVAVTYRLSNEGKFPAQIQDVKSAIRWTRANAAKYDVDTNRVGIWGTSVGGSVAAIVGTSCNAPEFDTARMSNPTQSSCVRSAVDWFGVTDMSQLDKYPMEGALVHNSPDSSQSLVLGCVLNYECTRDVVTRANPITYIDPSDKATKFLVLHGDADKAVTWHQSELLVNALKAKGVEARLDIVPGVGHYFQGIDQAGKDRIYSEMMAFFAATLKN